MVLMFSTKIKTTTHYKITPSWKAPELYTNYKAKSTWMIICLEAFDFKVSASYQVIVNFHHISKRNLCGHEFFFL